MRTLVACRAVNMANPGSKKICRQDLMCSWDWKRAMIPSQLIRHFFTRTMGQRTIGARHFHYIQLQGIGVLIWQILNYSSVCAAVGPLWGNILILQTESSRFLHQCCLELPWIAPEAEWRVSGHHTDSHVKECALPSSFDWEMAAEWLTFMADCPFVLNSMCNVSWKCQGSCTANTKFFKQDSVLAINLQHVFLFAANHVCNSSWHVLVGYGWATLLRCQRPLKIVL